jgi:hypothetical protein
MHVVVKRTLVLLWASMLAVGLAACASTTSTAPFKGEAHEVAQTVSNLQSDATARNEQKICANDLANGLVIRLNAAKGGCMQAIKNQLAEVDSFELSVQSVQVNAAGAHPTATAQVKSVNAGKTRLGTLTLVKEGGKWKISGI